HVHTSRRTCGAYFSVADLYGGGHSRRPAGTICIRIPCQTSIRLPGLTRSATCAALSGVMTSPGLTGAACTAGMSVESEATRTNPASYLTVLPLGGVSPAECILSSNNIQICRRIASAVCVAAHACRRTKDRDSFFRLRSGPALVSVYRRMPIRYASHVSIFLRRDPGCVPRSIDVEPKQSSVYGPKLGSFCKKMNSFADVVSSDGPLGRTVEAAALSSEERRDGGNKSGRICRGDHASECTRSRASHQSLIKFSAFRAIGAAGSRTLALSGN